MPERDEEQQLEALLRQFLSDELAPYAGRSQRHFRQYLSALSAAAWQKRAWLIGAFVSGLAASVALLWATPIFHHPDRGSYPGGNSTETRQTAVAPGLLSPAYEQFTQSRTTDEGVMMVGDTPVRVLRRQTLQQTRWFDGHDHVKAEQTTPKDDVTLIKLSTY